MRIQELLKGKGSDVVTVTSDTTVGQLVRTLADHRIGAVLVMDGDTIAGIISERDVVRALPDGVEGLLERPVSTLMTSDVVTCSPGDEVSSLAASMTEHRFRHLPVVQGDKLVGIVSIGDIVKFRLEELQGERDQLESYITS
ncbi:CBS domain-containing protein [Flexivirga endophytica]|uniref:CBS domain-containing protein n=2 Tax=Flexivirga endophytica TaxID=1849103 RepID=A0A916TGJ5_9MICO|nr:CBS domain-containing protein [Flexivirga endophytica]GGB43786.1 CBS domain-containing protein [Flexivirga endophytica]GHB68062.1 CBS domain-containing protein [Flexivirga endophytica]